MALINTSKWALIKRLISLIILLGMGIAAVIYSDLSYNDIKCSGIVVKLDSENERPLLGKKDINNVVTEQGTRYYVGKYLQNISLHQMEERVKRIPLVKSCEAHYDFSGKIIVSVKEYSPIARILRNTVGESNLSDQYVTQDGKFIGTSPLFTPRILVVSGAFFKKNRKNLSDVKGKHLIELFEFINSNEFWRAQISQLEVAEDGGVVMIPTLGITRVDFGLPINIDTKFKKLALFYKKIIPNKGWNTYRWVRLKYKNQVICDY